MPKLNASDFKTAIAELLALQATCLSLAGTSKHQDAQEALGNAVAELNAIIDTFDGAVAPEVQG